MIRNSFTLILFSLLVNCYDLSGQQSNWGEWLESRCCSSFDQIKQIKAKEFDVVNDSIIWIRGRRKVETGIWTMKFSLISHGLDPIMNMTVRSRIVCFVNYPDTSYIFYQIERIHGAHFHLNKVVTSETTQIGSIYSPMKGIYHKSGHSPYFIDNYGILHLFQDTLSTKKLIAHGVSKITETPYYLYQYDYFQRAQLKVDSKIDHAFQSGNTVITNSGEVFLDTSQTELPKFIKTNELDFKVVKTLYAPHKKYRVAIGKKKFAVMDSKNKVIMIRKLRRIFPIMDHDTLLFGTRKVVVSMIFQKWIYRPGSIVLNENFKKMRYGYRIDGNYLLLNKKHRIRLFSR